MIQSLIAHRSISMQVGRHHEDRTSANSRRSLLSLLFEAPLSLEDDLRPAPASIMAPGQSSTTERRCSEGRRPTIACMVSGRRLTPSLINQKKLMGTVRRTRKASVGSIIPQNTAAIATPCDIGNDDAAGLSHPIRICCPRDWPPAAAATSTSDASSARTAAALWIR